jgi:hypothetical protein
MLPNGTNLGKIFSRLDKSREETLSRSKFEKENVEHGRRPQRLRVSLKKCSNKDLCKKAGIPVCIKVGYSLRIR